MMKLTIIATMMIATTVARADTYWYCKGDECLGRSIGPAAPSRNILRGGRVALWIFCAHGDAAR